ncbi:MAG: hypothetical protein WCC87_04490 [Candidatus Korobacteraceae bacterium]
MVNGQWLNNPNNQYTYTAYNAGSALGVMQTPTPGSTLSGNVATFTWCAGLGATAYWMDVGSTLGGNNYYQSGSLGNVLTTTVYSLPADGSQIYVTLWSLVGGSGTRTNTITLPVRKDLKRDSMPPSSGGLTGARIHPCPSLRELVLASVNRPSHNQSEAGRFGITCEMAISDWLIRDYSETQKR